MKYSDKLNGYWEEGYHYYLEFRDEKLTVRNYRREIALETTVSYDCAALERGERTVITLKDNVLSRSWDGEMMTEIRELAWENGELKMHYYYTIMGDTHYTLKKVDRGPFDHIRIRDDEFIKQLQGTWVEWRESGKGSVLTIIGNSVRWFGTESEKFHVVSYDYAPDKVLLVPADLINDNFRGFTAIEVRGSILTTRMMIMDASVPLTVFARRDMLDKITVPEAAKEPIRSTMTYNPTGGSFMGMGMGIGMGMGMAPAPDKPGKEVETPDGEKKRRFCPGCGTKYEGEIPNFCPECGTKL